MSTANAAENTVKAAKAGSKADIGVAAGVVVCLALGAGMTYWLNALSSPPSKSVASAPVQGRMLNAPMASIAPLPAPANGSPAQNVIASKVAPDATALKPNSSNPDFLSVGFDTLGSFYYEVPSSDLDAVKISDPQLSAPKDQIPAPIKALGGKKVAIQGFMVPMKIEKGATKQFLLVKDQSLCCFGRMPRMNEWISVSMSGDRATKFIGDQPVTVFGTIDVGEEMQKGEVLSIFRMTADDVAGPLDL
jgi:hypothetical protein